MRQQFIPKIFSLCLMAILIIPLSSCNKEDSADVNQDRIHTVYEVFYNENDDVTNVTARFRFGSRTGTLLELSGDAGVTFNGQAMPYSNLHSGHWRQFAGKVDGGTFVYENVDNEIYTNTVNSFADIAFPETFTELSKTEAYSLEWVGSVLEQNEIVGLFVGSWTWGDDALFLQAANGSSDVVLGVNGLSNLPLGSATVYMDRWTEIPASQTPDAGGIIIGKHRAQNVSVNIID